jgi:hypothetical protein
VAKTIARAPPPAHKAAERPAQKHRLARRFVKRLGLEARRLLPSWLFFYLSFSLLRLTQTAVLQQAGVSVLPPSRVLAGSLIVAKAIITVDAMKLFRRLDARPVLISAFFKTAIYTLVVFVFQYSEALFEFRFLGLTAASMEFGHRLGTLRFWVIQAWLVILLFLFSAVRALARKLGRHRFRRLLLGALERRTRFRD